VFCIYLRTNSDLHHKLIGYYDRDEKCLLRGTDWIFKYSRLLLFLTATSCAKVKKDKGYWIAKDRAEGLNVQFNV